MGPRGRVCPFLAEQQRDPGKCRHNHQDNDERVDGVSRGAIDPRIVHTVTHSPLTNHADVTRECQSIGRVISHQLSENVERESL